MSHPLLESLNPNQQAAVQHYSEPALVIAGAGSGKTKTVVHRIAYLMQEHDVYPQQILAVTFTNKAAAELKERVENLIGPEAKDLWVSTFHSACLRILRIYGEHIELRSGFGIYDDNDQLDLLKDILKTSRILEDANPRVLRSLIDRAKSNAISPQMLEQKGSQLWGSRVSGLTIETVAEIYHRYEMRLRQANVVDFNDILARTVELFKAFPEVLDKVQQRAVFVHVDEYQDTNQVQYELTKLLANKYNNLMVVGDPDQSIYSFRGADIRNILDFQNDYSDVAVYRLEQNYRSTANILKLANTMIEQNENRLDKDLKAVKEAGEKVKIYKASDHRAEADFIARQVERLRAEKDYSLNDFTVLYRTNSQSRVIEEAMRRSGIAAKIVGGVGFYDRREVKDILSYTKAAINPQDDVSIKRIIGRPKRGIGKTTIDKLIAWAASNQAHFIDALNNAQNILTGTATLTRINEFIELLNDFQNALEELPAAQFLNFVIDASGYKQMLKDDGSFEAQARQENLDELISAVLEWQEENNGSIEDFLDEAALMASLDDRAVKAVNDEVPDEAVTLMTLHNAKGLEFPIVFLAGLEENLIPHRNSLASLQDIEEERRLLYVGITRAEDELMLIHCQSRMNFGRTEVTRPSRFLEDIPRNSLLEVDILGQNLNTPKTKNVWKAPKTKVINKLNDKNVFSQLKGGETVEHPRFGQGTVVGISGEGNKAQITVIFKEAGAKKLLVKYANLKKI